MNSKKIISLLTATVFTFASVPLSNPTIIKTVAESVSYTVENPYKITTEEDLNNFRNLVNSEKNYSACAELENDITVTADSFTPIGTKKYNGTFDGKGHTISGLKISGVENGGLFSVCEGAKIKNLKIEDSTITGKNYAGSIVGTVQDSTSSNQFELINCQSNATVKSTSTTYGYSGGLCGYINLPFIISQCCSSSEITGQKYAGGIVGYISGNVSTSKIQNCCSTGKINGKTCGGIIGYCNYNTNPLNVTYSYSTAEITADYTGALIGKSSGSSKTNINNCYYSQNYPIANDINESKKYTTENTLNKTETQFSCGEVAYLLNQANPDGENLWGQNLGIDKTPVINGEKVFVHTDESGNSTYSNSEDAQCEHSYGQSGKCSKCGQLKDGFSALNALSATLGGNIEFNFLVEINDNYANENTTMVFEILNSKNEKIDSFSVPFEKAVKKENNLYKFSCPLSAKQMSDTVKAHLVNNDKTGTEFSGKLSDYCEKLLEIARNEKNTRTENLVIAMLNYGAYSQEFFNYNTENPANKNLSKSDKYISDRTDSEIDDYKGTYQKNSDYTGNVEYYGSSLVLKTGTKIKHYFLNPDNKSADNFTCDFSSEKPDYSIENQGNYIVVTIDDIGADKLDTFYNFTLKDGDSAVETIKYSALSYAYQAISNHKNETDELTTKQLNCVRALYKYSYFANQYQ